MLVSVTFYLSQAGQKDAFKKGKNATATQTCVWDIEWNDDIQIDPSGAAKLVLHNLFEYMHRSDLCFDVYPEPETAYAQWVGKWSVYVEKVKAEEMEKARIHEVARTEILAMMAELEETRQGLDFKKVEDARRWNEIVDNEYDVFGNGRGLDTTERQFGRSFISALPNLIDNEFSAMIFKSYYTLSAASQLKKDAENSAKQAEKEVRKEKFKEWIIACGSERLKLLLKNNFDWEKPAEEEWISSCYLPSGFELRHSDEVKVYERERPSLEELHDLEFWKQLIAGEQPEAKTPQQLEWRKQRPFLFPERMGDMFSSVNLEWISEKNAKGAVLVLGLILPNGKEEVIQYRYMD